MLNTADSPVQGVIIELVKKLHSAGQSLEFICSMTGLSPEGVGHILAQLDGPQFIKAILTQAQLKSAKYRCSHSARLMRSPVQASDRKLYDKEVLEALLNSKQMRNELIAEGSPFTELYYLKEEIMHFSKETLEHIEVCLVHKVEPEATLSLVSDCLAVLSPETDLTSFLKVFEKVETSQLPQLLELLQNKSPHELMQALYVRLAEIKGLQTTVLAISRLLLSNKGNTFDEDFCVFISVIRKSPASSEVLALALDVAKSCSCPQLRLLREELSSKNWEAEQWRIDELTLQEAELMVKSGDELAAKQLLDALKGIWGLKGKVLEFFDRVNWKQEKLGFLDEIYIRSLETLKDQGLSTPLVEVLETLYQITKTQETSVNLKMNAAEKLRLQQQEFALQLQLQQQALDAKLESTSASVNQLSKVEQGFIYNYECSTSSLYWTNLSTGQQFTTTLAYTFKSNSSLCELPDGDLLITGGNSGGLYSKEVVCINTATHSVTAKSPMNTARDCHRSVYYEGFLYVIGGRDSRSIAECERYDRSLNKWEDIAPMPHAVKDQATIVCTNTRRIYTLGGANDAKLDLIQEFDLQSQMWKALKVKLPSKSFDIPIFKVKDQAEIFFIQGGAVHSFNPINYAMTQVKTTTNITSWHGPSYYVKGTLYYPTSEGPLQTLEVGQLS